MFLASPFLRLPFLDIGIRNASRMIGTSGSTARFVGSTGWDKMLEAADVRIAYFAEIEPWVLTDRS